MPKAILLGADGKPITSDRDRGERGMIRSPFREPRTWPDANASYDVAKSSPDMVNHWANADRLSPAASARPEIRKVLRSLARYEFGENNSTGKGLINTLVADTIGTGPRLQMLTKNESANRRIERSWNSWAKKVRLKQKLRTMRSSRAMDGESFLVAKTNNRLRHPVKLDLRLYEGDQCTTPRLDNDPNAVDGIRFDADDNPISYDFLIDHPGTDRPTLARFAEVEPVTATQVIHYFLEERPGQKRGIPEVTAALRIFAEFRRFFQATRAAAEVCADLAAILYTDHPTLHDDSIEVPDEDELFEIQQRLLMKLPMGWKAMQMKAEHPATTLEMFRDVCYMDAARCLCMPLHKAIGTAKDYTFASGGIDLQGYYTVVDCERSNIEDVILDEVFLWWLDEAALIPRLLPSRLGFLDELPHRWAWDRHPILNPEKQAGAIVKLHEAHLLTDEDVISEAGGDIEEHYDKLERQIERRKALGIGVAAVSGDETDDETDDESETDDDETEEATAAAVAAAEEE